MASFLYLIGFTWAFHALFTLEPLCERQPDVKLYGRLFSWSVIFLVNVALVLVWLACTTTLTFGELGGICLSRAISAYVGVGLAFWRLLAWIYEKPKGT